MRRDVICLPLLLATSACGQSQEVNRLKALQGEYDFGTKSVGLYGTYSMNVGVSMKVTSSAPNSVGFKEEFEIQNGFSRDRYLVEGEVKFDTQTKRYLFNFRTAKRAIKDLVLSYTDDKGWEGTGEMSIPRAGGGVDEKVAAEVSITPDRAKREQEWKIMVPNPSDPKNALESYRFKFANRPPASNK